MTMGVYAIVNTQTGKRYVGSSMRLERRWRQWRKALTTGRRCPPELARDVATFGLDCFRFVVIESVAVVAELEGRERIHVLASPNGTYNRHLPSGRRLHTWHRMTGDRVGRRVMLNELEKDALDWLAGREQLPLAEYVRMLIRKEADAHGYLQARRAAYEAAAVN